MKKGVWSGVGSGSIIQRYGSRGSGFAPKCHGSPTPGKTISEIKKNRGQVETGEAFCNVGLPPGALSRSAARTDVKRKKILTSVELFDLKYTKILCLLNKLLIKIGLRHQGYFLAAKKE